MSYINPLPPRLEGDDLVYQINAGGKPKTNTPKDKRLRENQPAKQATPKQPKPSKGK